MSLKVRPPAWLVLADGTVFEGEAVGYWTKEAIAQGEVVFNTAMSGYQEVITDPSYAGQIITFTTSHLGNYGVSPWDLESSSTYCSGIILNQLSPVPSNWRSSSDLESFLISQKIPAIAEVDTRAVTLHIRSHGSMPAAFGTAPLEELKQAAIEAESTNGKDLVSLVSTSQNYYVKGGPLRVIAYDFGLKKSSLDHLRSFATIEVVPAHTPAQYVLDKKPDGVFLSNGPGDPAALGSIVSEISKLVGNVAIFGICLGHQLLALSQGATTYKLPFGHHGCNHPILNNQSQIIEITSQNHNYAVDPKSLAGIEITHINLNDQVVEGISLPKMKAFSVQYHPEAGPGPHDASYLFSNFVELMKQ